MPCFTIRNKSGLPNGLCVVDDSMPLPSARAHKRARLEAHEDDDDRYAVESSCSTADSSRMAPECLLQSMPGSILTFLQSTSCKKVYDAQIMPGASHAPASLHSFAIIFCVLHASDIGSMNLNVRIERHHRHQRFTTRRR